MDLKDPNIDFWSLTPLQLASECQLIADGVSSDVEKTLREEAGRLSMLWQEALDNRHDDMDARARKAGQRSALRKRTVEILVKLNWSE